MSPIALTALSPHAQTPSPGIESKSPTPKPAATVRESTGAPTPTAPTPAGIVTDIPRRPSPWHDIAHSLSTTSLPPRAIQPPSQSRSRSSSFTSSSPLTPADEHFSTSQALREWDARLLHPDSDAIRHQLIHTASNSSLHSGGSQPLENGAVTKLEAERDKHGFIEYKLKLIDPTPERFERLVTQMMWRLKQGKNEAIYELGLADDGTVVGLPRSQMDASLRTLELMASEVGATVIILKEIVLHSHARARTVHDGGPVGDLQGLAARLDGEQGKQGSRRRYKKDKRKGFAASIGEWGARDGDEQEFIYGGTVPRQMIFAEEDLKAATHQGEDTDSDGYVSGLGHSNTLTDPRPKNGQQNGSRGTGPKVSSDAPVSLDSDDADTDFTFNMDLDLAPPAITSHPAPRRWRSSAHTTTNIPTSTPKPNRKDDKKRRKSVARQEQRRLDLLRGDGTNPMWTELVSVGGESSASPPKEGLAHATADWTQPHFTLPHQPVQPSSLRLTTPAQAPHDSFVDDLLCTPLDSLSLSFADVRTVSAPISPRSSTPDPGPGGLDGLDSRYVSPLDELVDQQRSTPTRTGGDESAVEGEELICVEALVVRKLQHDENDDGDGSDRTGSGSEWGYGGEEDVWGFGSD